MSARFVAVTGLPRAGSTPLCRLLARHPAIHCEGRSYSHYHMKYLQTQSTRIVKPGKHEIPRRIRAQIQSACA